MNFFKNQYPMTNNSFTAYLSKRDMRDYSHYQKKDLVYIQRKSDSKLVMIYDSESEILHTDYEQIAIHHYKPV